MNALTQLDQPTLIVGDKTYSGWKSLRISRGLDRCATDFDVDVTERWTGQDEAWPILPFSPVVIKLGADPVMTGYVDRYNPEFTRDSHSVRISGRSKTMDLIDCTPDIEAGAFTGYTLAAICRSICALFGIEVVVETDAANTIVADAKLERSETAWTFLERLCRLAAVLACDDAQGRLVLTRAGAGRANGALTQGENILRGAANFNAHKRFSTYIVKGQHALGGAKTGGIDLSALAGPGPAAYAGGDEDGEDSGVVLTSQSAHADDPGVPRYRPHVSLAESQLTQAGMQLRANWQRAFGFGRSLQVHCDVQGWRQPNGALWAMNELVPVKIPYLGVDADLLVAQVEYTLTQHGGRITHLMLGPIDGYTPDPGQVRHHKAKHHKGGVKTQMDLSGLG